MIHRFYSNIFLRFIVPIYLKRKVTTINTISKACTRRKSEDKIPGRGQFTHNENATSGVEDKVDTVEDSVKSVHRTHSRGQNPGQRTVHSQGKCNLRSGGQSGNSRGQSRKCALNAHPRTKSRAEDSFLTTKLQPPEWRTEWTQWRTKLKARTKHTAEDKNLRQCQRSRH